jgi:rod shape-determining protein MreB
MPALLRKLRGPDLAVDAGTATVRVASSARPGICEGPARIGGCAALRGGVIADPDCGVAVVEPLLARVRRRGLLRPRVVASVPSDADGGERAALSSVLHRAGAAAVAIVPEPLAAAVGTGIDVGSAYAQMVADIGHGVTDCVVIRAGAIIASRTRRVGCGDLEEAARRHVARTCGVRVGARTATRLLLALRYGERPVGRGAVVLEAGPEEGGAKVGRVEVELAGLAEAIAPVYRSMVAVPAELFRGVADDVGAELVESGVHLSGGGALLPGVVEALAARTRLDVRRVPDPLRAVVRGNRRMIATVDRLGAWV